MLTKNDLAQNPVFCTSIASVSKVVSTGTYSATKNVKEIKKLECCANSINKKVWYKVWYKKEIFYIGGSLGEAINIYNSIPEKE